MPGADAGLTEKHGAAGRFASDERPEHQDDGRGENQADERAGDIDQAFERAVEEPGDGELLDAEDGQAADRLQTQSAHEHVEGTRNDLPFHVGAFAAPDDAVQFLAGQIEPRGDEQIDLLAAQHGVEIAGDLAQPTNRRAGSVIY